MISLSMDMLMDENLYPSGRQVRVWVSTTHTRISIGKIYSHHIAIYHVIKVVLPKKILLLLSYVNICFIIF